MVKVVVVVLVLGGTILKIFKKINYPENFSQNLHLSYSYVVSASAHES